MNPYESPRLEEEAPRKVEKSQPLPVAKDTLFRDLALLSILLPILVVVTILLAGSFQLELPAKVGEYLLCLTFVFGCMGGLGAVAGLAGGIWRQEGLTIGLSVAGLLLAAVFAFFAYIFYLFSTGRLSA